MSFLTTNSQFRLALVGICVVAITGGLGRFAYTPIIPYMQNTLNISSADIGLIASSNYLGYLIGSIIPLIYSFANKQRLTLYLSVVVSIVTLGLMGSTSDFYLFVLLRFVQGISGAIGLVIATNLIFSQITVTGRIDLRLAHISGFGVGMFLSAIAVWICSMFDLQWHYQWFVIALICLVLTIPIISSPLEVGSELSIDHTSQSNKLSLGFVGISVGYFFFGFGYIIFGTFIAALAVNTPALENIQHASWILVGISAMPAIFIWQAISKLTSNHISLALSCFTCSTGILTLYFFDGMGASLFACLAYGIGVVGIVGLVLMEGKIRHAGSIKFAVAFLTTTFSIGQIVGPYISGLMIDFFGDYQNAMLLSGCSLFMAGICMINYKLLFSRF